MLLNVFFIYLVAFATDAAAFSSKRIGRWATDKNSLSNVSDVTNASISQHYSGQNAREKTHIFTEGGLKCQGKKRIRRRGSLLQSQRHRIHDSGTEKFQPGFGEGCLAKQEVAWVNKKHGEALSITAAPLSVDEKEEIGVTNLVPLVNSEEAVIVARDNKQHEIKYRSLGNEENSALSAEDVKGETAGNKLLDQSAQGDGDDDYDQEQEQMSEDGIKSSIEEIQSKEEINSEQTMQPEEEDTLTLLEKRHKRRNAQNSVDYVAKVAEKQTEEAKLNNRKHLLEQYEEDKIKCNKNPGYSSEKDSLSSNNEADAVDEDKEHGQDTQALTDEDTFDDNAEETREDETMNDKSSSVVGNQNNGEEEMEEENMQRSKSMKEENSLRELNEGKGRTEEKSSKYEQKLTNERVNKQELQSLPKTRRSAQQDATREGQKKSIDSEKDLEQASADMHDQTEHISRNYDDSKSSLEGKREEGGERDEEETLGAENAENEQESNNGAVALEDKENYEENLEGQAKVNEEDQALKEDEVLEEVSEAKYADQQVPVEEPDNQAQSENEENNAVKSGSPYKRQVSEVGVAKDENKQAVEDDKLEAANSYEVSAPGKNGVKITKRSENSEKHKEENEQALTDNVKESGEEENETSSLETSDENQEAKDEKTETSERAKQELSIKGSWNNDKVTNLGGNNYKSSTSYKVPEVKEEQDSYQPQVEIRVQQELPKGENSNEAFLDKAQTLDKEGSKDVNLEQQVSEADYSEEPIAEEKEAHETSSSETEDEFAREGREVGQQDRAKIKCPKSNYQASLSSESGQEAREVASEIETDTQTMQEGNNQLLGADENCGMAPQEILNPEEEEETDVVDQEAMDQELEPDSEYAEEQDLQPEREVRETGKKQS